MTLAYLRKGETFASLAAGFDMSTATAWRYVSETVALMGQRGHRNRGQRKAASAERVQPCSCSAPRPSERGYTQLKTSHILRRLRCCPGEPDNSPKPST